MNVDITNKTGVPQYFENFKLEPQERRAFPLEIALKYKESLDLHMHWDEIQLTPSVQNNTLAGIAFASPLSLFDGYGLIGVYTVREFLKQGIDVDLYFSGWLVKQEMDQDILDRLAAPKKGYSISLAKGPPASTIPLIPVSTPVSFSMWESDRLPDDWPAILNTLPLLLVPTKEQVNIYRNSGVTAPIKVIPDPIDTVYWRDRKVYPEDDVFKIVSWSKMTSRKMPIEMVTTFMRAFPLHEYPNMRFELKTNGRHFGGGKGLFPQFNDPRIVIHDGAWPIDQLRDWVSSAHCAYFLSHGEGMFNPPMQSMALGVPTILPNHTGPADFSDVRYNYPVDLDPHDPLVESPMGENMRWWNPDLEMAVHQLRNVYHNYEEAKRRAAKGSKMIHDRYNVPLFVKRLSKELVKL